MSSFVILPPPDYVAQLLSLAPLFAVSGEFQSLDPEDRTCPGLVFSAFAKFLEASLNDESIVGECGKAIEHFASSHDPNAENHLIVDVFEAFRQPDASRNILLPLSRRLYDQWLGG